MLLHYCDKLFPSEGNHALLLTRKGLLETIGPAIVCPKGVTTGLAWPKAGNPPPKTHYMTTNQSDAKVRFAFRTVIYAKSKQQDPHRDTHHWAAGDTQEAEGREPVQERVAGRFH